ncbi:MAG: S-methyl-5-thioribose-1-phosphate isomerase [Chromatiales bacterium]|nr:S-methyl-5-thioribose-1-phosphate isomerase [Chromatiales bacterium]
MTLTHDTIRAVRWRDGGLELLDQRKLPAEEIWLRLEEAGATAEAIRAMVVRGAPAIGITAAFGVVLAARQRFADSPGDWRQALEVDFERLAQSRPTAVNLFWALDRMRRRLADLDGDPFPTLLAEAQAIHDEDIAANRRMGELGAALIESGSSVLTHCNTGSLATGGYGTALGVIRSAWSAGKLKEVYADETRPWLQGSRLTAWELVKDRIPVRVQADGAAAWLMAQGKVDWVIVGSDRIAANGDVANKIGTYSTAVLARHHGVKFMVAAPISTVDPDMPSGAGIPIETRDPDEILSLGGQRVGAVGADAWNPVFDVTPAELVDAIVTEKGVVERPNREKMLRLLEV